MYRKLIYIFFLSVSLLANSAYLDKVYSYDKQMKFANDVQMLRIFHSLQNIYIKSIIKNDEKLKIETLKRLIKSSRILHIDDKNYKKELSTLIKKKPDLFKKNSYKKNIKNIKKPLRIRAIKIDGNSVSLLFDRNILSEEISSFSLKSKKYYKKVFDFNAILPFKPKIKKPNKFINLRVAQYDKNITRFVLESKTKRNYILQLEKTRAIISFYKHKNIKYQPKTVELKPEVKEDKTKMYFNYDKKIIVLDPGHGGKDSGAIGFQRRYEKKAVLQIALRCAKELKKRGYKVYLTRSRDYFVGLRNRTKFANRKNADLFISIHANAAPKRSQYLESKGLETFFLSPDRSKRSMHVAALENKSDMRDMDYYTKNTFLSVMNREKIIQANKMALDVQQGMLKSLRQKYRVVDGGVREAPFWVLVGAQMPAILIETGYITNPTEGVRLFNFQYQNLLAKGIADGVDNYFLKN